ncbi:6686_t:CDS:2, partial [Cetraspora pellucida]
DKGIEGDKVCCIDIEDVRDNEFGLQEHILLVKKLALFYIYTCKL